MDHMQNFMKNSMAMCPVGLEQLYAFYELFIKEQLIYSEI